MKKLILYGNTDFSRLIKYYIEDDTDWEIQAVTVEKKYMVSDTFEGLPVIPFEDIEKIFSTDEYEIILGIGYGKMNSTREKIFNKCKEKGYKITTYIHSTANVSKNVQIGEGNIILENALIQPYANIGVGNLIWCMVLVAHDSIIGNFNTLAACSVVAGMAKVGNNCFLGNHSTIRDKHTIANYSLIGANAFINKDTEEYCVYVPQKSIKLERNSLDINI